MQDSIDKVKLRIVELEKAIGELQALRISIVTNPAEQVQIEGVTYRFETQSELDAVLQPKIEEHHFLTDLL